MLDPVVDVPPPAEPTPVVVVVVVVVEQLPPEHVVCELVDVPLDAPAGAGSLEVGPGVVEELEPEEVEPHGTPPGTETPFTVPGQLPGFNGVGEGDAPPVDPEHVAPVAPNGPEKYVPLLSLPESPALITQLPLQNDKPPVPDDA